MVELKTPLLCFENGKVDRSLGCSVVSGVAARWEVHRRPVILTETALLKDFFGVKACWSEESLVEFAGGDSSLIGWWPTIICRTVLSSNTWVSVICPQRVWCSLILVKAFLFLFFSLDHGAEDITIVGDGLAFISSVSVWVETHPNVLSYRLNPFEVGKTT